MQVYENIRFLLRDVRTGKIPAARVLTAPEAIAELGISRQGLDSAIVSGKVDGWRADHLVFVDSRTVKAYKAAREATK